MELFLDTVFLDIIPCSRFCDELVAWSVNQVKRLSIQRLNSRANTVQSIPLPESRVIRDWRLWYGNGKGDQGKRRGLSGWLNLPLYQHGWGGGSVVCADSARTVGGGSCGEWWEWFVTGQWLVGGRWGLICGSLVWSWFCSWSSFIVWLFGDGMKISPNNISRSIQVYCMFA